MTNDVGNCSKHLHANIAVYNASQPRVQQETLAAKTFLMVQAGSVLPQTGWRAKKKERESGRTSGGGGRGAGERVGRRDPAGCEPPKTFIRTTLARDGRVAGGAPHPS